ncbi:hypothetical protein [Photobacterium galatheae]|uniref:hypothetical protein n=1 Tax=Photobacterium galatheae TaxID=1654360 RepID=UPI0012697D07|nr:hypothetical protein [Photobacterium galatheae]MCM0149239.1 hypothetical protein [Photobacterium galatheae]
MAAFAHLNIISDSGRPEELKQVVLDGEVYKRVVDIGDKKFIHHPVDSFASDLPIGLALPSIVPSDWVIDISDELSEFSVSWDKTGNWDDVIVEISKRHNLVVVFDWNRNVIQMKLNDAEMLDLNLDQLDVAESPSAEVPVARKNAEGKYEFSMKPVVHEEDKSVTDSLVVCAEATMDGCTTQKIDIEKLALDTQWLESESKAFEGNEEIDKTKVDKVASPTGKEVESASSDLSGTNQPEDIAQIEKEREMADLKLAIERDKKLRAEYQSSYILHGDGSYEDFVNGGGFVEEADPDTEYVYVFKRGKLFDTIKKWAEFNDFYVENEIFENKRIDYPNSQEIRIKGKFKDVTTLLLNKYRKAEVPVNHKYYTGGGANTLYIFESKYESMYVN